MTNAVIAQPIALAPYEAGKDYLVLDKPIKVAADDKIEVMEVFWYGCGHCYSFEPYVLKWKKTMADDVSFMRTPAVWRKQMQTHASLYYIAEQLDLPTEVHNDLFVLLTKEHSLVDMDRFALLFSKYGVAEEEFTKLYNSFAIKAKVKQGENRCKKNYKTSGTPEVVVNGKYRLTMKMAGGPERLFKIVNYLIEQERQNLG